MGLTARQKQIAEIVRAEGPITGQRIADKLHVTRAALRSDLAILIRAASLTRARRSAITLSAEVPWAY